VLGNLIAKAATSPCLDGAMMGGDNSWTPGIRLRERCGFGASEGKNQHLLKALKDHPGSLRSKALRTWKRPEGLKQLFSKA
jgi:hypothetical protein